MCIFFLRVAPFLVHAFRRCIKNLKQSSSTGGALIRASFILIKTWNVALALALGINKPSKLWCNRGVFLWSHPRSISYLRFRIPVESAAKLWYPHLCAFSSYDGLYVSLWSALTTWGDSVHSELELPLDVLRKYKFSNL